VIVRERPSSFVLVEQHEHGKISGTFAEHWADRPRPLESALYAIANHDIGWRELDASVRWNEETGRPYSFADYPVEPKLRAYTNGLDRLESRDPYAACLCSMHYGSFVQNSPSAEEAEFRDSENRRRQRLRGSMSGEELENLERNFRLLQLCDDLSLFVCLNEPGRNEHPWYRDGFELEGTRFEPLWEDRSTLSLRPNPFSRPFGFAVPYRIVGKDRSPIEGNSYELRVTC
jgi:hypothetical protein